MSSGHTRITYTSWGERMQQACCGVCLGIILFVGSFPLLTWNEGRSIARYQSLEEGRGAVVVIPDPTAAVDKSREGALVYLSGKAVAAEDATVASDPTFGVAPAGTLKLQRVVEMYQWEETKSSKTTKTNDGGTQTVTTYSYRQTWSDHLIDSSFFDDSYGHENPTSMPYPSQEYATDPIAVGSYTLSNGLVGKINWWSSWTNDGTLSKDNIADDYGRENAMVYGNGFYLGNSPGSPEVGDMKIQFKYIPEGTVSLVAAQTGETFSPYVTKRGGSLLLLRGGYHTADELFALAERDNVILTWLVRLGGFVMMYIGLQCVAQPLEVILDRIPFCGPFFGDLMAGATSLVTCIAAAALSILTIAVAWLAYRPLLTFTLLAIVGGLVYMMKKKAVASRGGGMAGSRHEIPTVKATPVYDDRGSFV